jgi:hypothetical protein
MNYKTTTLVALGFLTACSTSPQEDKGQKASKPLFHSLTNPVILVGDTQEHHIGGLPVASIVNAPIDKAIDVTIRPPQQSLFGRKLMESITLKNPNTPLIHLGDLLDVSCQEEWNRISPMMMKPTIVMAHGNHDGIAHGIFNDVKGGNEKKPYVYSVKGWSYECFKPFTYSGLTPIRGHASQTGPADIFTSSDFIEKYTQYKTGLKTLPYRQKFIYKTDGQIEEIVGRLEPEKDCATEQECSKYTNSFILQKIRLPATGQKAVKMLILDTSQYDGNALIEWPRLGRSSNGEKQNVVTIYKENPGTMGHLKSDQIAEIARLVAETPANQILLFAGHHDWKKLNAESQKALSDIFSKRNTHPLIYFSAHTHTGFMKNHALSSGRTLTEVNTNSLADWPISLREMSLDIADDQSIIRINSTIKLDSLAENKPNNNRLSKRWETACVGTGAISQHSFDAHSKIAISHRYNGQSILNLAFFSLEYAFDKNSSNSKNLLYEDKLNDLNYAKTSIIQTMNDLPGYKARLEKYLSSDKKSICHSQPLNQCFAQSLSIPDWKYRLYNKRTENPQHYYFKLSELYSAAQKAVDDTVDPKEIAYMKCAFVSSAISDNNSIRLYKAKLSANAPDDFYLETINAPM